MVEGLKHDLQVELMEMLMPGEEEAKRLAEAVNDDEDSMDDALDLEVDWVGTQ